MYSTGKPMWYLSCTAGRSGRAALKRQLAAPAKAAEKAAKAAQRDADKAERVTELHRWEADRAAKAAQRE